MVRKFCELFLLVVCLGCLWLLSKFRPGCFPEKKQKDLDKMSLTPPQTPQRPRPSRFIYPPEVHRSKERVQATLQSIINPLFDLLYIIYQGHPYTRPENIIQTLDRIQSDYMRQLTSHFFISPVSEQPLALYKLRHYFGCLEDIFEDEFCGIEGDLLNEYPTKAIKAAARAGWHERRWQGVVGRMVRDGSLRKDWGEMRLEDFVKVATNYMVFLVSLKLAGVERDSSLKSKKPPSIKDITRRTINKDESSNSRERIQ
ncbi:hypothetical protein B0H65DRAFT_543196 [Neurospora tetraspora]|uniref:Uncharacterized protein n=1 Tax=Neurospora tetraspora TaxID=94610 RepID=A0AAE0MJ39_9PEZI|nr:hypothetical protein B0H65DRAFT_543196 [Neurospora tetraspora]